jgi:hypothetical protein
MAKPDKDIKRDLKKIKLIGFCNLKNPNVYICSIIETIKEIKKKDFIFESDILESEL